MQNKLTAVVRTGQIKVNFEKSSSDVPPSSLSFNAFQPFFKVLWEVSYWARDWGASRAETRQLDWDETKHQRGSLSSQFEREWVAGKSDRIFNLFFGRSSQREDSQDRNCVYSNVRILAQGWPSLGTPSPLIFLPPSSFLFSKMSQNTEVRLCNFLLW